MKKTTRFMSLVMILVMLFTGMQISFPVHSAGVTISFDANGGQGAPAAVTVDAGSVITLTAQQPKKAGMVFRGWAFNKADADAGYITYSADQTHQILCNSSATLYASYAYEVNLNPGLKGWGSTQKLYKFPTRDLELFHHKDTIQANYGMLPGASGDMGSLMVFVEWNTAQLPHGRGDGASYHEKYTANTAATLYCIWGNPVIYDADGGTFPISGSDIQESYVAGHSGAQTLESTFVNFGMPEGENAPYKAGARQVTDEEGNVQYARIFTNGNIVRNESKNTWLEIPIFNNYSYQWADFECAVTSYGESGMKFTAIWEPSVTYKANGGEGKDVVEYMTFAGPQLHDYNDYTVLDNSFEGNGFKGWNTKPDGTGVSYAAGDVITDYNSSEPLTLYAQWADKTAGGEYYVSFNAMEGYLDASEQSVKIAYGQAYSDVIDELPVPTRAGYTFVGWYNEAAGSELNLGECYSLTEDTSFTAQYELHGHHFLQKYRKNATCTEEGYYTQVCTACDYVNNIVYEKTPHIYGNWNEIEDGRVAKFCNNCLYAQIDDSTEMIPQEIIAYNNYAVGCGSEDYKYIDTLNYIGPAIDNGPGSYPFGGDYFSNLNGIRNRARAQNPDIKIVLTIFNRDIATFESWIQNGNYYAFADQLVNTVVSYGFDGLDIDYEFPTNAAKSEFVALLSVIRAKFNTLEAQTGKHYILSIATPASVWAYTKFDLPGCAQYVDYINMMNYDLYCGANFPYTHHHTPPYDNQDPYGHILTGGSVQSDITLYKSLGVPASKIVAGCGMYSRRWNNVSATNNGLFQSGSLDESNIHYDTLMYEYVNKNGFTRYWDDSAKAPYLYNPYSKQFISYDDKESISYKIKIVENERIRGLMLFDYVTCDSCGIIPWIGENMGSTTHECKGEVIETKNQTCTENGFVSVRCSICNSLTAYTELFREGHYSENWTVKTAATKAKAGVLTGKCVHCNGEATREIAPLGYTVTFDADGGSVVGSTKLVFQANESYDKASHITAVKDGKNFAGWYCEEYGYTLNSGDNFTLKDDVTFKAIWSGEDTPDEPTHEGLGVKSVDNYTVTIDGIKDVKEIRFAIGRYTAGSELKAAEKNLTLDAATVAKYTSDSRFTYDLPWMGEYTFWIRFNDGSSEFLYTNVNEVEPYVTSYGVKLTVNDFGENYKDAWLAKGNFNSYNEIKASTDFKYQASATKLANYAKTTHDFTYTMEDPGDYTVLIRYNDGTYDVIHHTLTVTTPILEEDGLRAVIQNIPDIKIIRTAYGHYESVADIKKASTVRYFNNKTAIKDAEEYMIQYREEGEVTIIVEYNDGYKHYFYYNVQKKVPTYTLENGRITFSNLDDLYIIRYAQGKYTTSNNIKNAPGSMYKKAQDINGNGQIIIDGLTTGRWSFMVQYNDESYNFYVIDIA